MELLSPASLFLDQEARALLTRLERVKPFSLQMTSVLAAAQTAIESCLAKGRCALRELVLRFIRWLRTADGQAVAPAAAQSRFTILRMRFNAILSQFDIFADALVQRSEHDRRT